MNGERGGMRRAVWEDGGEGRKAGWLLAAVSMSFIVATVLGMSRMLAVGATTIPLDFLLYLLVGSIVVSAIWSGFILYSSKEASLFILLLSIIALMLLSLALPATKFAPFAMGSIAAGIVVLFIYVASLRSS